MERCLISHVSRLGVSSAWTGCPWAGAVGPVVVGVWGQVEGGELRAQTLSRVAGRHSECLAGQQQELFLSEGGGLVPALGRSPRNPNYQGDRVAYPGITQPSPKLFPIPRVAQGGQWDL